MSTTMVEEIIVDRVYPQTGGSQFLVVVQHTGSEVPTNPLLLPYQEIGRTVLANIVHPDKQIILRTPLPSPHNLVVLPKLEMVSLRPEIVRNEDGKILGMLLRVPSLFVQANQLLQNYL